MSGVLLVAAGVATPLALVGLVAALGYFAYSRQMRYQEKKLEALPPEERAARTDEYLTRYGIDGKKLKVADKLALIRDEMEKRHRRSLSYVMIAAVVFVICFALSVAAYVAGQPDDIIDKRARRLPGPGAEILVQVAPYFRRNSESFPGMQDLVSRYVDLAARADGQFFCSYPLDVARTNPTVSVKRVPDSHRQRNVDVHIFVPRSSPDADLHASTQEITSNIASLKLNGHVPEGSIVFAAYWVEGETPDFEYTELEVFIQ